MRNFWDSKRVHLVKIKCCYKIFNFVKYFVLKQPQLLCNSCSLKHMLLPLRSSANQLLASVTRWHLLQNTAASVEETYHVALSFVVEEVAAVIHSVAGGGSARRRAARGPRPPHARPHPHTATPAPAPGNHAWLTHREFNSTSYGQRSLNHTDASQCLQPRSTQFFASQGRFAE